jgi:hypothetical protein
MSKRELQLSVSSAVPASATQHSEVIQRLAADANWPVPVVAEMYWHQLNQLQQHAKVETYLGLVTARKVREALRHMPPRR